MLTRVRLSNFKCFEELELELRPLTILIGPNGAGKSTASQALMLLRQSLQQGGGQANLIFRPDQPNFTFTDLVGFEEVVYRQDRTRTMTIAFAAETELPAEFSVAPSSLDRRLFCAYEVEFGLPQGFTRFVRNSCEIRSGDGWTLATVWWDGLIPSPLKVPIGPVTVTFNPQANIGHPFNVGTVERTEGGLPENAYTLAHQLANYLSTIFKTIIDSWRFVPPLRGFAHPDYPLATRKTEEIYPLQAHDTLSADIASTLGYDEHLEDKVSRWIEMITGVPIEHNLNEPRGMNQGARIGTRAKSLIAGRNVPIVLEGFGSNQLVFLMFALARAPVGGLATVEEPEIHLHPFAIARLGDLLVEIVTEEKKQLLVTTHSEHLLLSLLNNVAEGKMSAEDLAVYYYNVTEGFPSVTRLEVTSEGMIKGGLPGFFDAALQAQARLLAALSEQQ